MEKLGKVLLSLAFVMNVAVLVCLDFNFKNVRSLLKKIHEIRVQLPKDFLLEVSDKVAERTAASAGERLSPCLSKMEGELDVALFEMTNRVEAAIASASERLSPCLSKMEGELDVTLFEMTNRVEATVMHIRRSLEGTSEEIVKLFQKEEKKKQILVEEAQRAYALYQDQPTNGAAILYLQVAIRKDPSHLEYIRALGEIVKQQAFDPGIVQTYQSMLSYCLAETPAGCCEELCKMVLDFRSALARHEEKLDHESDSDSEMRRTRIAGELAAKPFVDGFERIAQERAQERISLLEELMSLSKGGDDDQYEAELKQAKLVCQIAEAGNTVRGLLGKVEAEILEIKGRMVGDESDLREQLSALGGMSISRPVELARRTVLSLYGVAASDDSTKRFSSVCHAQFKNLENRINQTICMLDGTKAEKILACVDTIRGALPLGMGKTITAELDILADQAKIIAAHIGTIGNPEAARLVLNRQEKIVEQSKERHRRRLEAYQKYAYGELKVLAAEIRKYKEAWTAKTKKIEAEKLLRRLVKVDQALLLPQIQEMYQYEYSKLLEDYNAWIENEEAYDKKAEFMYDLEHVEKTKLEAF